MVILNSPEEKLTRERPTALKDTQRTPRNISNLENMALRNVVQDSWRSKVKHDKHLLDMIDDHAANMNKLLGNAEYEIFCIHNLIANTKNMTKAEVKGYIKIIEGLGYFYNIKLGKDLTSTLLTGLTFKAKNLDSLGRYYKGMMNEIDTKIKKYENKATGENKRLEDLMLDLRINQTGFFNRIFKKGRVEQIKRRIDSRKRRLDKINMRIGKHKNMMGSVTRMIKGNTTTVA